MRENLFKLSINMRSVIVDTYLWSKHTGEPPRVLAAVPDAPRYTIRALYSRCLIDPGPDNDFNDPLLNEDGIGTALDHLIRHQHRQSPPPRSAPPLRLADLRLGDLVEFERRTPPGRTVRATVHRTFNRMAEVRDSTTGEGYRVREVDSAPSNLRIVERAARTPYSVHAVRYVLVGRRFLALWCANPEVGCAEAISSLPVLEPEAGASGVDVIAFARRVNASSGMARSGWIVGWPSRGRVMGPIPRLREARKEVRGLVYRHMREAGQEGFETAAQTAP